MSIRIIDNKKIDMTEDEYKYYTNICRSYDRTNCKGEELFKDLFETDDNGMIVFVRPSSTRQTSMEIFLFITSILHHQSIRMINKKVDALIEEVRKKVDGTISELRK